MNFFDQYNAQQRRLHALDIQAAQFGISTPPHISNEADDIRKMLQSHPVKMLLIHENNLAQLLKQRSLQGEGFVTPGVVNGIAEARRGVAGYAEQAEKVGFHFMLQAGFDMDDELVYVAPPQAPPPSNALVGKFLSITVEGAVYTGRCVSASNQRAEIEWEWGGVTFRIESWARDFTQA